MAKPATDDILVPGAEDASPPRSHLVAFVPITVALVGVVAILFGQVSARDGFADRAGLAIDPVVTGSIPAAPATESGDVR